MKLRNRLFLWIGAIFLIAFGVSLFLEIRLTNRNLQNSEDQLKKQILEINEQNREYIENYLKAALIKEKSQIDALFLRVENNFTSIHENPWVILGQLFLQNNWVDLAQISQSDELAALLLPIQTVMKPAKESRIDELVSWVVVENQSYIGIPLEENSLPMKLLFYPKILQQMQPTGSLTLDRAIALAKNTLPPNSDGLEEKNAKEESRCLSKKNASNLVLNYLERPEQAEMIASLVSIFPSQTFGNSPLASTAPEGIAHFMQSGGVALFSKDVFHSQMLFHANSYMQKQATIHPGCKIGSELSIVVEPSKKICVANAMQLADRLFLTVGIGIEEVAKTLSLTLHKEILIMHKEKIIGEYTPTESRVGTFPVDPTVLSQTSGFVTWENHSFYYLRLQPFRNLDLYFYILTPQKDAFSLLDSLEANVKKIVEKISWNMRSIAFCAFIVVLGLVHNIARRITRPITQLAKATEQVAAGKLEGITLPPVPVGRHDEVASLCHSFEQMVHDLKEKEKVKGVLNKVVSQEIAKEILKGTVHLGGEARKVTVLFADIRHFTQMTTQLSQKKL